MSAKAPAAPAAAAAAAAGDAPAKGSSKLPLIALGVMVVANLGGTAVIALRTLKADAGKPAHEAAAEKGKKGDKEPLRGPVVPIDTFVVNLNEPSATRYLKATFEIEVASGEVQKELEESRRALRDNVLRYLSNLTLKETMGDTNKAKIKEQVLIRARDAIEDEKETKIKNLFFTEFVVQ